MIQTSTDTFLCRYGCGEDVHESAVKTWRASWYYGTPVEIPECPHCGEDLIGTSPDEPNEDFHADG